MNFDREILRNYKICIINPDYTKTKFQSNKSMRIISDPSFLLEPKNDLNLTIEIATIDKANIYDQINKLHREKNYDLYFNICSGIVYDDVPGFEVISALEYYNLPYCGSDERFLNITKKEMKSLALKHSINTPKYWFVHTREDILKAAEHINAYPMFIKHYNGCGSKGVTIKSKINTFEELNEQATDMINTFGGALVEEYIDGREFTTWVIENDKDKESPFVLDSFESIFHGEEKFKYFDAKYMTNGKKSTIIIQPVNDVKISEALAEMARSSFVCMYGKSHARLDFRINDKGEIFFLEINPQPRVFCPGASGGDLNYKSARSQEIVEYLFYLGVVAYRQRQVPYNVSYDKNTHGKQGVFANRNFARGEIIFELENKPRTIVSRQYASCLKGRDKEMFTNYAYQIGDDMYAFFFEKMPINHSCEPYMWFDKQTDNIYSRCLILKGEQLTLDYATFVGETEMKFECKCGCKSCRKVFNGHESLSADVKEKYFGHFSVYLQRKFSNA